MEINTKPTGKQKRAFREIVENGRNLGEAMVKAGYSPNTAKAPTKMTTTKGWEQLLNEALPDKTLTKVHKQLLKSTHIEHMVFPLNITDDEIKKLLEDVNCTTRKFQHSETQIHVWFWCANDKARKDALDMAYKLKGRYKEKSLFDVPPNSSFTIEIKTDDKNDRSPVALQTESSLGRITKE